VVIDHDASLGSDGEYSRALLSLPKFRNDFSSLAQRPLKKAERALLILADMWFS
jgi:hypothetical protein